MWRTYFHSSIFDTYWEGPWVGDIRNINRFKKNFKKADRYLLLYKLAAIGVSGKLFYVIKAMYSDNKCAIMLNNYVTPWFESTIGIRHGDSLSPKLLSIFMYDLALEIYRKHCVV